MQQPDIHLPHHIVAASAVVTDGQGRVLLVRHPRRGWEFPGGQVEPGEDLFDALRREVREETGLAISPGRLAGVYLNLKLNILELVFVAEPLAGDLQASPESPELGWYPRSQVLEMVTHPVLHDRARDLLASQGGVTYRAYATNPYTVHGEREL